MQDSNFNIFGTELLQKIEKQIVKGAENRIENGRLKPKQPHETLHLKITP